MIALSFASEVLELDSLISIYPSVIPKISQKQTTNKIKVKIDPIIVLLAMSLLLMWKFYY